MRMSISHIYIVLFAPNQDGEPEKLTVSNFYDKDDNPNLDSLEIVGEALNFESNNSQLHFEKALILYEIRKFDVAIKHFTKTIKLTPKDSESYYYRGRCFLKCKNFKLALKDFQKMIELNPTDYLGYFNLAILSEMQNEYQLALDYYSMAISISSDFYAYLRRGKVHRKMNQLKLALNDFNVALSIDENDLTALKFKNEILSQLKRNRNFNKT